MHQNDKYQDIRDAVRDLCAQFPDEYHRKVDERRAYPEEFVDALPVGAVEVVAQRTHALAQFRVGR